jgi:polyisoprenoid-binding protein YceI
MTTWTLDKAHSEIKFKAKHLMITTVTGQFTEYDATVGLDGDDFAAAAISFTAKTASVNTGMSQRDDHLRSDDFFNSEAFPDLTFTANGMTKTGDNTFTVTGDMTIRDVTKPVTLSVELSGVVRDPWGQTKAGFTFTGTLNRKDFGLKFHVVNEAGDLLVSDEIKLEGDVQLLKG